jgi:DNA mismatch repair ATPase MutS
MKLTPVRKQYLEIKRQYPDAILFFRLGDFYETFDEDAEIAARELDIVLTSRNVAKGTRIPMAGVPHHAAESYLARLIEKGYHVAICEQVGDGPVRGLFPREVIRVVTPGTVLEAGLLPSDANNYLAAVVLDGKRAGIAYADVSTGEFAATQFEAADLVEAVTQEIGRLNPAEVIFPETEPLDLPVHATPREDWRFELESAEERLKTHLAVASLDGFGVGGAPLATMAAGGILDYVSETQRSALPLLTDLRSYSTAEFMVLDAATRQNLELTETLRTGAVQGSLLGVLDATVTPMGRRTIRQWISQPLLKLGEIEARHDHVQALFADGMLRAQLRKTLGSLPDIERVSNRATAGVATPRDLVALRTALQELPQLLELLQPAEARDPGFEGDARSGEEAAKSRGAEARDPGFEGDARFGDEAAKSRGAEARDPGFEGDARIGDEAAKSRGDELAGLAERIDPCQEVLKDLITGLTEEPPAILGQIGVIKAGYSAELDELVEASREARDWIANLESVERARTGIGSLKVGYNKVFGYYIEVTKANSEGVPEEYIRKQTLVNAERYITPEMKEYEARVLSGSRGEERLRATSTG